ncbi:MAG: hypothetical protein GTN65_05710, partial [Armatimonadetes bacterium]|nr:hypothetical protein [Armatimonadota bacterium]NIO96589.1 hypothetical protein [Armatimonadota bacterium]
MKRLDYLLIIGLILLTGIYSADALNSAIHPFEDAAMLLRYSQHLAEG